MNPLSFVDYQPNPALDTELAALAYACLRGWPDQRPITAALVRSRLHPIGHAPATTLGLHHDDHGALTAAAAIRWPTGTGDVGRIWGPLVHPTTQRNGLGRALLDGILTVAGTIGERITTAEIPATRLHGCALFHTAGWTLSDNAALLRCSLPLPQADYPGLRFRHPRPDENIRDVVAKLYHLTYPGAAPDISAHTLARWSQDERFQPCSLTLAEDDQRTVAIALVYPLAHTHPDEPAEALLGDILIHPDAYDETLLRQALIAHALNSASPQASIGRFITTDLRLAGTLTQSGFRLIDTILRYKPGHRGVTPAGPVT
ncbi:GNAT family N-acetyltransferase [Frankia sp. Cr1]|uniref:GNAT family N-acetyltransferase n=1 Tax=Frankia sp. Cr1 TaxID=3073931 RepID=UPI002AD372A3|nr:GNAT family N-acetyltransferase [Frankia sp. Cr1]